MKAIETQMPRPSQLQAFLNKCPKPLQDELIVRILKAATSKDAFNHLKSIGYRGGYDSVLSWRNSRKDAHESLLSQSDEVSNFVAEMRGDK